MSGPRFFVPETVQTSGMDCGPASLKSLLEGWGIPVSYGRLREACQTDVDGTSIDTLEEIAVQLGLDAEQVMLPPDHLLLDEARALPALVVVRHPNGMTHFIIVWRRHGSLVQVMDPAAGRRWLPASRLLDDLYRHEMPVPAAAWREWAGSDDFLAPLRRRLADVGVDEAARVTLLHTARDDGGWRGLATLDAATRMVAALVHAGALRKGAEAARLIRRLSEPGAGTLDAAATRIPDRYWSVRPLPAAAGEPHLLLRGAVLVRVRGRLDAARAEAARAALAPELVAALAEPPSQPARELLRLALAERRWLLPLLVGATGLTAAGIVVEALLLRGFLDVGQRLGVPGQRVVALGALALFMLALLLVQLPLVWGTLGLGRQLEVRLRLAFLRKIPRLRDRYFQSRPISDMAERSHAISRVRTLADQLQGVLAAVVEMLLIVAAVAWLYPASLPVMLLAVGLLIVLPLAVQPLLAERNLRLRTHHGALGRFYLDAMLGLVPIRGHNAERAMRREHESLLVEWARAGLAMQRGVVAVQGAMLGLSFGAAAWLLLDVLLRGEGAGALLLVYWALKLPLLGERVLLLAEQYPIQRTLVLRLLEPLRAPDAPGASPPDADGAPAPPPAKGRGGVRIEMQNVRVRATGHTILTGLNVEIGAGEHVAIVGPSGAGKSTLVGLLLGWHQPAEGCVRIDGEPLDPARLERLRRATAWVDPAVQLWNRSLLANLQYGTSSASRLDVDGVIDRANLRRVVAGLANGLRTPLGEGGALLAGGEGQRVRLARAMLRAGVRLAILDEPFRGLDRSQRRHLLAAAREQWANATLLCVTHDVGQTRAFPRVLVVEGGRLVEDGAPDDLLAQPDSRYRALLEAERSVHEGLWQDPVWRRLWLAEGQVMERGGESAP